jgi:hypothetical protein
MWHRVGLLQTDVSAESVNSIIFVGVIYFTMKMEETRSSETSVYNKPTVRHIQEDGILHSHRRENLRSYRINIVLRWS